MEEKSGKGTETVTNVDNAANPSFHTALFQSGVDYTSNFGLGRREQGAGGKDRELSGCWHAAFTFAREKATRRQVDVSASHAQPVCASILVCVRPPAPRELLQAPLAAQPRWPDPALPFPCCLPPSTKGIPTPWDHAGPGRGPQRAAARCRQLRDKCGADPAPLTPLLPGSLGAAQTSLSSAF